METAIASPAESEASADPIGTIPQLADQVDETEPHVRQAIDKLRTDTARVQTTILDGETQFYREG